MASGAALSVRSLSKDYGRNQVLSNVSFDVAPGEVVALLGENGAGKSTLCSIVAGLTAPSDGTMTWQGHAYAPASPADALHAGIGLIHQELRLLPELSIAENIFLGRLPVRAGRVDRAAMFARAEEQLTRLGLRVSPALKVKSLRVAAQQQVEIAKALVLDARLLILDEPTAALGAEEAERLFDRIRILQRDGVSFIYVSHRLDEIARVADRVIVLRDGQVAARFDRADVPLHDLVEAMVGRPLERLFPPRPAPGAAVRLEVRGLTSAAGAFSDVSFAVSAGEVFGIAGIVGAGRTELVRAIAGADALASGDVLVDGAPVALSGPGAAAAAGIVLVPEDRARHGLVLDHSLASNVVLGRNPRVGWGWVTPGAIRARAVGAMEEFGIRGRPEQPARQLSGGNQQKVVIARVLSGQPKVVMLDEPTRGIDVGARAAIYAVIAELISRGLAVVLVSSDLDEVLGLSHRVMVIARGRSQGILSGAAATRHAVMTRATA